MSQVEQYHTRADISVDDVDGSRRAELRSAFDEAEYGERIQHCIAAVFEVDSPIEKGGVIVSSWLHHDRIFDMVSSFGAGNSEGPREHIASATVRDIETDDRLSAHVTEDRVLISLRDEDVAFESFVAYALFLEQRLDVELTPVIS